ncbi:flagellar protein FlaG [Anaerobacillus sp. HL2]|nr:flagellar protein FlaG [Anaerobacillus sp. HL2]
MKTKEVVRQIPPKEFLIWYLLMLKHVGLIVDKI